MNDTPYRTPTSSTEPEEPTPDFQSPGSWSIPRKVLAVALANLVVEHIWGLHETLGERLVGFAVMTLAMSAVPVLGPVLGRWRARRNARAVARLMGEDL